MADKLTVQQSMAVRDRGGKLLVSAAAGSGKTKVLVDRLLQYLTDPYDPANLDEFLIITYTKAAALELRGKITEKLTQRMAQEPHNVHLQKQLQRLFLTKISTVHGFCSDLLREYAYQLDIPGDFRVADEHECQELRQSVLTQLMDQMYLTTGEDQDLRCFIDTQGLGRDDRLIPEIIQKVYDSARCHLNPEQWLEHCVQATDPARIKGAEYTPWGVYLIRDLKLYLNQQITVLTCCAQAAQDQEGMEKAAANLWDTIYQLRILEESESWDQISARKNIDYGRLVFPKKNVDQELIDRIKAVRNACKKGLDKKLTAFCDDSRQVMADIEQSAASSRGLVAIVQDFSGRYAQAKQSRRVLDFSDLEHKTLDLLLGRSRAGITKAAIEIGARYREIMVDEYQDSNGVQDAIFSALTSKKQNCFMVGDVKQSIYQFRLADPGIFLEKYDTYSNVENAVPGEGRKILLSHNFRSGGEVIEAVNDVFSKCMTQQVGGLSYTEAEQLREGIPHTALPEPAVELHAIHTEEDSYGKEAAFVAERIEQMLCEKTMIRGESGLRPVRPEDIVILLRSPGSVGSYYQKALEHRGIKCSTGAGMDLLQTEEIGTLRSLLQVIINPRQDIPLISILVSPVFAFTADNLAAFRSLDRKGNVYDALLKWDHGKGRFFLDCIHTLRQEAGKKTLCQLLEKCFSVTKLDSIYGVMPGGEVKKENLQSFYKLASDYESNGNHDLAQFLQHLDALEGRGLLESSAVSVGAVTIMSIHKSKGLEFPVVFLSGLARKFNRDSLKAPVLCDKRLGLGFNAIDQVGRIRYPSAAKRAIMVKMTQDSISEELRVLYVAMTRARDRLIMTYASKTLPKDLEAVSLRQEYDGGSLICAEADCPGDWILLTAVGKTEAGELHACGSRPMETIASAYPWKICISDPREKQPAASGEIKEQYDLTKRQMLRLKSALDFRYPHLAATKTPSKQTATGRKGREKDEEAAQNTLQSMKPKPLWRKPGFCNRNSGGVQYGNAIHTAMQYIQYEKCGDVAGVTSEIIRMKDIGLLTDEEAAMVDCGQILSFFASDIGRKIRKSGKIFREFKFSILDPGTNYGDGLEEESVLLQGVVDCAVIEEDGITIIDFKSDRVTEESVDQLAEKYRMQVISYCQAMSRIFDSPVKESYLYFFQIGKFVKV